MVIYLLPNTPLGINKLQLYDVNFNFNNYSHANSAVQVFFASNNPYQLLIPENIFYALIPIVACAESYNLSLTVTQIAQGNITLFYKYLKHISYFKYICNKVKKSELIYPFHFFK